MSTISKVISAICAVVSIACFFFKELTLYLKIIVCLTSIIVVLARELYSLRKHSKAIAEQLNDRIDRHQALASQFDKQSTVLDRYQTGFTYIIQLLNIAAIQASAPKIREILKTALTIQSTIIQGDNRQ